MPRTARADTGGYCYHVISRGNKRSTVFHDDRDYARFVDLLSLASIRVPMRIIAYCLMPNHFHLALWPHHDGDLGRWMHWLLTSHVAAYRWRYESTGRIWQGRYKAFPIQQDVHLLMVLRYIERNPLRAGLVDRAQDWAWSSLGSRRPANGTPHLDCGPVARPEEWIERVNRAETQGELAALRTSAERQSPFGRRSWQERTAHDLGLESTLRSRGRPAKDRDR